MELERQAVKRAARELIQGKVFALFLIIFVVGLLSGGVSGIVTNIRFVPELIKNHGSMPSLESYSDTTVTSGFSFGGIFVFVLAPLTVALAGMLLEFIRGRQFEISEEFNYVFTKTFDRYFAQKFLLKLLVSVFTALWSLLLIVPGIIYHYKTYFVDYIMAENPQFTWQETIELSKKLTKNHKGELFVFDLSFILWYMLVGITAGIAGIYVFPYVATAQTLYYEGFRRRALQTGELTPDDFVSQNEKTMQAINGMFNSDNNQPPEYRY